MNKNSNFKIIKDKFIELELAINLCSKISKKEMILLRSILLSLVEKIDTEIHGSN